MHAFVSRAGGEWSISGADVWACLLCQTSEASALMEVAAEWQVVLHRAEEYAAMTAQQAMADE